MRFLLAAALVGGVSAQKAPETKASVDTRLNLLAVCPEVAAGCQVPADATATSDALTAALQCMLKVDLSKIPPGACYDAMKSFLSSHSVPVPDSDATEIGQSEEHMPPFVILNARAPRTDGQDEEAASDDEEEERPWGKSWPLWDGHKEKRDDDRKPSRDRNERPHMGRPPMHDRDFPLGPEGYMHGFPGFSRGPPQGFSPHGGFPPHGPLGFSPRGPGFSHGPPQGFPPHGSSMGAMGHLRMSFWGGSPMSAPRSPWEQRDDQFTPWRKLDRQRYDSDDEDEDDPKNRKHKGKKEKHDDNDKKHKEGKPRDDEDDSDRKSSPRSWGHNDKHGARKPWDKHGEHRMQFPKPWEHGDRKPWESDDHNNREDKHSRMPFPHKPWDRDEKHGDRKPWDRDDDDRKPRDHDHDHSPRKPWDRDEERDDQRRATHTPFPKPWDRHGQDEDRRGPRMPHGPKFWDHDKDRKPWDRDGDREEMKPWDRDDRDGDRKPWDRDDDRKGMKPWDRDDRDGDRKPWDRDGDRKGMKTWDRDDGEHRRGSPWDRDNEDDRRMPLSHKPWDRDDDRKGMKPWDREHNERRAPWDRDDDDDKHRMPFPHKSWDRNGDKRGANFPRMPFPHKSWDRDDDGEESRRAPFSRDREGRFGMSMWQGARPGPQTSWSRGGPRPAFMHGPQAPMNGPRSFMDADQEEDDRRSFLLTIVRSIIARHASQHGPTEASVEISPILKFHGEDSKRIPYRP